MEELLNDILDRLRQDGAPLDPNALDRLIRKHNRGISDTTQHLSKHKLLPWYLDARAHDRARWLSWQIDEELEQLLVATLRMKPRRTASGVATITVLTHPWPCSGNCVFCPSDIRMPKSYLHNEPACQRAEHVFFDPYLQVALRLRTLGQMGHPTDKVEIIVLGGTWSDYPEAYQTWFVHELFRAANDWPAPSAELQEREEHYRHLGFDNDEGVLIAKSKNEQERINRGERSYNQAVGEFYRSRTACQTLLEEQRATLDELACEQRRNETATHRIVGLVVETRPDAVTPEALKLCRQLGCTKIQMGIQSTSQDILDQNDRGTTTEQIRRAFSLIRLYGFKIHTHLMVNLMGSTPKTDKHDFSVFAHDPSYMPDEVKLYPCVLVEGARLMRCWHSRQWTPYSAEELVDVLVSDTLAAPAFMRISRMIRDISSTDIIAGNKRTNLRQMVEERIRRAGEADRVHEMRFREIAGRPVDLSRIQLEDVCYDTTVSREHFLQWVTPEGLLAGFCRLSLPCWDKIASGACNVRTDELPCGPGEAMIREVHVYGVEARLNEQDPSAQAQHRGLGRALVEKACSIAQQEGFSRINVISSVGTRDYYRHLGFFDGTLYQSKDLSA